MIIDFVKSSRLAILLITFFTGETGILSTFKHTFFNLFYNKKSVVTLQKISVLKEK